LRTGEGPQGEITLDASYSNATRVLGLDLVAEEEAEGIVVNLLGVPGSPSPRCGWQAKGRSTTSSPCVHWRPTGPIGCRARSRSGGRTVRPPAAGRPVTGDLAPLLAPDQVAFFGNEVALKLDARRTAAGRTTVDRFD
jgi:translocation and assembly module TamB